MTAVQNVGVLIRFPFEVLYLILYTVYIWVRDFARTICPGRPRSLENEIILVTGGANGIGRGICQEIVAREKNVTIIIWDVDTTAMSAAVAELKTAGVKNVFSFVVDVSDRKQVAAAADTIRDEIGDVTFRFNNAGLLGNLSQGWNEDPELFEKVFGVNVFGHSWTIREFLPKMIEKGTGHIVATCSVFGFMAPTSGAAYSASKFAVRGFMESMKEDVRHLPGSPKIGFTTVYPEFVATNMTTNVNMQFDRYKFINRTLTPAIVAKRVVSGVLRGKELIYVPGRARYWHYSINCYPPELIRKIYDFGGVFVMHDAKDVKSV